MSEEIPRFKHDCERCRFIRRGLHREGPDQPAMPYDFYVCGPTKDPSLIARWSNQGSDYSSLAFWGLFEMDPTEDNPELLAQLYLEYIETPDGKEALKHRALASLFFIVGDFPLYDMDAFRATVDPDLPDSYVHILYLREVGHDFSKLPKALTPRMAKQAERVMSILLS